MSTVKVPIVGTIEGDDGESPRVEFNGYPALLEHWIEDQQETVDFHQRQVVFAKEQVDFWLKDFQAQREQHELAKRRLEELKSLRRVTE